MPDCIVKLLHNLYGDVSIHFDLGKLMEDVQYKHSFLQGAPDLPLQYMLTYQPFLDKFESSGLGLMISLGSQKVCLAYMAYANNTFFILSSEEDMKVYWVARCQYDITSGAQLNAKESFATVIRPAGHSAELPTRINEFKANFKELSEAFW